MASIFEELLVLKSIFCAPNEIQVRFDGVLLDEEFACESIVPSFNECEVRIILNLPAVESTHQGGVDIKFKLSNEYPLKPPNIELTCEFISNEAVLKIIQDIEQFLNGESPISRPSLFEAIEHSKALLENISMDDTVLSDKKIALHSAPLTNNEASCSSLSHYSGTLIIIDHMRNQSMYLKILKKWADRYDVLVKVVDYGLHNIYVQLLSNDERNIDVFMKQWKTQCVDVDSHGKPCKEHLLTVVSHSNHILMNDHHTHQKYVVYLVLCSVTSIYWTSAG